MRRLWRIFASRLPLHLRVLVRQFLLRVIDLEALSIEADIPRFLGQFAGILIFISITQGIFALMFPPPTTMAWHVEQSHISSMMLVIGLLSVITWDATFPDRRDVMVLGPLPVSPRMILLAKVTASSALTGLAIASLNCTCSFAYSLVYSAPGLIAYIRFLFAWWFTMVAAAVLIYGAVLCIQGFTALLLPRRIFLVLSAVLQLAAFALLLSVYFLEPSLDNYAQAMDPSNHWLLACSPVFWLLALFNQVNGALPQPLSWVAQRAWIALAVVIAGAAASLLLCYLRTMKKTVEDPDLVPGAGGLHWNPTRGGLYTAIAAFCLRSLTRSRQHRLAFAFFLSLVFAIALTWLRHEVFAGAPEPVPTDFLIASIMMMALSVLGLRATFSLPIALQANWILRITQLRPTGTYFAATRLCLLLFAVVPMLIVVALLALNFRPWQDVAVHLFLLALLGCVFVEFGLFKFDKLPFTCSYLPGKANVQVMFWGFAVVGLILGITTGVYEQGALHSLSKFAVMASACLAIIGGLGVFNRIRARTAVLYFEEVPPEIITRLGLIYVPPPATGPNDLSPE